MMVPAGRLATERETNYKFTITLARRLRLFEWIDAFARASSRLKCGLAFQVGSPATLKKIITKPQGSTAHISAKKFCL